MKIISNYRWRDLDYEKPDWATDDTIRPFFTYKNHKFFLEEFQTVDRFTICDACGGSGKLSSTFKSKVICWNCKGFGKKESPMAKFDGFLAETVWSGIAIKFNEDCSAIQVFALYW